MAEQKRLWWQRLLRIAPGEPEQEEMRQMNHRMSAIVEQMKERSAVIQDEAQQIGDSADIMLAYFRGVIKEGQCSKKL